MNTRKRVIRFLFVLFAFAGIFGFSKKMPVSASVKKIYNSKTKLTKTVKIDITGNQKKDKIIIDSSWNSQYECLKEMSIAVNGKKALNIDLGYCYLAEVFHIRLSNKNVFLWIQTSSDNDDPTIDSLFQFDTKTNKLKKVFTTDTLQWKKGVSHIYSEIFTKKEKLIVKYNGQMNATGYIIWSYTYQYKNGKFKLESATVSADAAWHDQDFEALKTIEFYDKAGSKSVSFRLKAGKKARLKKICVYKNEYFLQFQYGSKSGWIPAEQYEIFKDVMLAG